MCGISSMSDIHVTVARFFDVASKSDRLDSWKTIKTFNRRVKDHTR